MGKKHQKHAKLKRPQIGVYNRNEFAILGTPCGEIKKLAKSISDQMAKSLKISYIDADHKSADDQNNMAGSFLDHGAHLDYTDKIDFQRIDLLQKPDDFQIKSIFNSQDLVLVNGNHFKASQQIVVVDSRKPLDKKLDRLTDVKLILLQKGESKIPQLLLDNLSSINEIPVLEIDDIDQIVSFVEKTLDQNIPSLNGLVLAGGRSIRMETDKTKLNYHGKAQSQHMFEIMDKVVNETFYSIREDQTEEYADLKMISDSFLGLGPYGAILSAFMKEPDAAWLVTASDQPFLTAEVLQELISKRNPSKVATAFYNPETDFPEPLITIWEPRAYSTLLQYLSLGYSCPRKVLINSEIEMVHLDDASVLENVNTPEEYKIAKAQLNS